MLRKKFKRVDEAVEWLSANPNCYPEITLQTTTYLTSEDRRRLSQAHDSLSSGSIIPDIRDVDVTEENPAKVIDLSQSMEALFTDYFKNKNKGQEPNERLRQLFSEILATDPE